MEFRSPKEMPGEVLRAAIETIPADQLGRLIVCMYEDPEKFKLLDPANVALLQEAERREDEDQPGFFNYIQGLQESYWPRRDGKPITAEEIEI